MPPLRSEAVVARLSKQGFRCVQNSRFQSCSRTGLTVWVLTGTRHTMPVLTMTVPGSRHASFVSLGAQIGPVLRLAHVNEVQVISAWYAKQEQELSNTVIGKWRVAVSRETGDQPGTVLTLTDKACGPECHVE